MCGVKIFVVFAVAALNLAVVPRRVRLDELVAYAALFEPRLEQCGSGLLGMAEPLCEFGTVIRPDTFRLERKSLKHMFKKFCRTVCAVFLESL